MFNGSDTIFIYNKFFILNFSWVYPGQDFLLSGRQPLGRMQLLRITSRHFFIWWWILQDSVQEAIPIVISLTNENAKMTLNIQFAISHRGQFGIENKLARNVDSEQIVHNRWSLNICVLLFVQSVQG